MLLLWIDMRDCTLDINMELIRIMRMEVQKKPSFLDHLTVITKRRQFILKTVLIVTGVSVIVSLLIPNQYTATTTILPPNLQQDMMFGFVNPAVASALGGTSGITSLLTGGTGPSDLFAAILKSSRIKGALIDKYDLKRVFRVRTYHDASKQLDEITRIGVTPEGMVSVSVTWYDKYLATDIANSYVEELDEFNTETAMTTGKKYRIFIEKRLNENTDSLELAENELREFQEKHRTVALDVELENAIATIAQLKAEIILLEVKKAALGSPGDLNSPQIKNINRQLRELKQQLSKIEFGDTLENKKEFGAGFAVPFSELPEIAVEYARRVRDVEVQAAIFELLTQQYEQAKIMEAKDTPTVQVLDHASPPEKKSQPRRSRIVIFVAIFSLILGIFGAFLLESFEQLKTQPDTYQKWTAIYEKICSDTKKAKVWFYKTFRLKLKR